MQREIRKRIKELAKQHKIPESVVQKVWESQFRMIRDVTKHIDLKNISEEELNNIKTNFNWKYIGKLIVKYASIKKKRETWEKSKTK